MLLPTDAKSKGGGGGEGGKGLGEGTKWFFAKCTYGRETGQELTWGLERGIKPITYLDIYILYVRGSIHSR